MMIRLVRLNHIREASLSRPLLPFAALAATFAMGAQPARADNYAFQDIVNNGDVTFNQELGINTAGTIAGYFGSGAGGHPNQGYTAVPPYGQPNFTPENFTGSVQTQVTGINDAGVTVGFWSDSNIGVGKDNNFGFVNVGGTFTNVNNPATPPAQLPPPTTPVFNQLLGVNNSDIAVGFYTDATGVTHGYTYNIAAKTFSPNINDPNAGTAGGQGTTAAAINNINGGEIAGFYIDAGGVAHGFTDIGGVFTTIDPTGSMSTMLLGLNDNGLAVGTYIDSGGVMHGLLYNLDNNTFQNIDDPFGIGATTINGINDRNQLVGFYVNGNDSTIGLLANPIPEPPALPLFAAGLLGTMILWRRRKA
jgi:hypothetical protein